MAERRPAARRRRVRRRDARQHHDLDTMPGRVVGLVQRLHHRRRHREHAGIAGGHDGDRACPSRPRRRHRARVRISSRLSRAWIPAQAGTVPPCAHRSRSRRYPRRGAAPRAPPASASRHRRGPGRPRPGGRARVRSRPRRSARRRRQWRPDHAHDRRMTGIDRTRQTLGRRRADRRQEAQRQLQRMRRWHGSPAGRCRAPSATRQRRPRRASRVSASASSIDGARSDRCRRRRRRRCADGRPARARPGSTSRGVTVMASGPPSSNGSASRSATARRRRCARLSPASRSDMKRLAVGGIAQHVARRRIEQARRRSAARRWW